MFQLDDQFLADVGVSELPESDKQGFLQHVYEELQLRVGTSISDGMSDDQLAEYESVIDRDVELIAAWLDVNAPDFLDDPVYVRIMCELGGNGHSSDAVCDYAATKWLEINRPDYRDVVAEVLEDLRDEIRGRATELVDQSDQSD